MMTPEAVIHIISQAFWTTVVLCAPLLLIGFAVGIVVNIIQIATSLQDSAFSTIPRLAAFLTGFLALLPWMWKQLSKIGFAVGIVVNIIQIATSLQDSAFSTIPRLAAFLTGFLALLPWMWKQLS